MNHVGTLVAITGLTLLIVSQSPGRLAGQETETLPSPSAEDAAALDRSTEARRAVLHSPEMREALNWVRQHVRVSLIHTDADLKALEDRVRRMSVSEERPRIPRADRQ